MNKGKKQAVKYDELFTPSYAIYPILPYLMKIKEIYDKYELDFIIWECTGNNSTITEVLRSQGFTVIETHKDHGFDFLKDTPDFRYSMIVSNPPYSLKNLFLSRAFELGKPFAFLLPLESLTTDTRGDLFRKYSIQVLVLGTRIDFTGKKSPWQNTSWFFWRNILPRDLVFTKLKKEIT